MEIKDRNDDSRLRITIIHDSRIIGYIVIDSIIGGHSHGGLRLMPDIDEDEIGILARGMTLKFGFLGLPHGGAKAGVVGDPEAPLNDRLKLLTSFGKSIYPLLANHIYIPATDMGTEISDIRHMVKSSGVSVKKREFRVNRTGFYTALTVFTGAKKAVQHLGLEMSKCSAAIEGYGKVGSSLGDFLYNSGVRLVAISTSRGAIYNKDGLDVRRLNRLTKEAGSRVVDLYDGANRIDRSSLLELPVDILLPCARHHSVHGENVKNISARIICPGANNPVTLDAQRELQDNGIMYLPSFITNSGGVLGGTMEFASIKKGKIVEFVNQYIGPNIASLLDKADREKRTVRDIAVPMAMNRLKKMKQKSRRRNSLSLLFELALDLYRRGCIPSSMVRGPAYRYFEKAFQGEVM
ncbi:glutamate dehydrogenase family protein [delta proteobacterium NaphS2]|nr:glutamate dehydrogenase family protein [delta proteobacterium NaphS2]